MKPFSYWNDTQHQLLKPTFLNIDLQPAGRQVPGILEGGQFATTCPLLPALSASSGPKAKQSHENLALEMAPLMWIKERKEKKNLEAVAGLNRDGNVGLVCSREEHGFRGL